MLLPPHSPALAVLLNLRSVSSRVLHSCNCHCYFRLFCKLIEFSHLRLHLCLNRLDLDCVAVLITYLLTQCYGSSNGDRTGGHIQWNTTSGGKTIHVL